MKLSAQLAEIAMLGIIGGAVPGPMLTAVFTEVLNGGFKKSLFVVLKALVAESFLAALILIIVFSWNVPQTYFQIISLAGAVFLFWLASQVWKIDKIGDKKGEIFSFPKIFLLTFLSGAFWMFWIGICVPRAFELSQIITGGQFLFLLIFELSWFISTTFLAFVFSRFRPILLKKNLVSAVFKFFALMLVFFALRSIWASVAFLLL